MKPSRLSRRAIVGLSTCVAASLLGPTAHADNAVPNYKKVVLVIEENTSFDEIIRNPAAPYANFLATRGAVMTRSYGTEHPSQPNYLDLFSGGDQNISDDNHPGLSTLPFTGENLGAQLLKYGHTFVGYSEDLPYAGDTVDDFGATPGDPVGTHDYARKHNPWVNWQYDPDATSPSNQGSNYLPSSVNQTYAPFAAIVASGDYSKLPDFSIVVPNQQHDDHGISGGASGNQLIHDGDTWLLNNLNGYAQWAKTHNSLLIVTWDEDDYAGTNQIPTLFYGAHIIAGQYPENNSITYVSTVNADTGPQGVPTYTIVGGIDHWNILRTIEDIFHLDHAGQANEVKSITDIFGDTK